MGLHRYRGHSYEVYEKSFRIDFGPTVYCGKKITKTDFIERMIDIIHERALTEVRESFKELMGIK